jgi:hypothetical protein
MVSPGVGKREARTTRSVLMLPITMMSAMLV